MSLSLPGVRVHIGKAISLRFEVSGDGSLTRDISAYIHLRSDRALSPHFLVEVGHGHIRCVGGGPRRGGGGMSPVMLGLMGLLAYRTLKGKGRLADMLGTGSAAPGAPGAGGPLSGGALGGGLKDLLDRFRQSGQETKAQSWVAKGPNEPIAPDELENALGEERLQWLMEQTGMPKDQLLAGLSDELPSAIDELTPEGRLPTDAELNVGRQQ